MGFASLQEDIVERLTAAGGYVPPTSSWESPVKASGFAPRKRRKKKKAKAKSNVQTVHSVRPPKPISKKAQQEELIKAERRALQWRRKNSERIRLEATARRKKARKMAREDAKRRALLQAIELLQEQIKSRAVRLANLSPEEREYSALHRAHRKKKLLKRKHQERWARTKQSRIVQTSAS